MAFHLETGKLEMKCSYRYDALGRRTATVNAEGTERHVWDGDHCLADVDEEGNVLRAYLWGPGVDNLLAVRVGGRNYAALTDIQGTVWGYANERGEIAARWTYDAWGNVLTEEVSIPALAAVRYRFQGHEFSRATGLTNFRARWYDPVTGRWLSKDPIGLSGGLNFYVFCENAPTFYIDPSGASGLAFFARPTFLPRFFDNAPRTAPRPVPEALPRGWKPGDPVPNGFKPPPNPKGNFYNKGTRESLHPDMDHGPPQGPHWDYVDTQHNHFRIDPNGNITPKILPAAITPSMPDDPSHDKPDEEK